MGSLKYLNKKNKKRIKEEENLNHFSSNELKCRKYSNALILPYHNINNRFLGGVVDSCGNFIAESRYNEIHGGKYDVFHIEKRHESVVFIANIVMSAWGHTFTDDFKYLWWLTTDEFRKISDRKRIKLACIKSSHIHDLRFLKEFLNILSIDSCDIIEIEAPTQFYEIYLPDPCLITLDSKIKLWTNEYRHLVEQVKIKSLSCNSLLPSFQDIYFSRTQIRGNRDFGEKYVEEAFRKKGFHIIYPEKLSILEQIWYLCHAERLATTEGSISHNAVFMKKHSTLVLLRKANYINQYQLCLNEVQNLNVIFIDANLSIFNNKRFPIVGPFFIYVNKHLAKYLGYHPSFPIVEYIRYCRHSLFHRDIFSRIFKI